MASYSSDNPVVTPSTPLSGTGASASTVAAAGGDPMLVSITEAMIKAYPELAGVRDLYLKGDFAGATNLLYTTKVFTDLGPARFSVAQQKLTQRGVYDNTIAEQWLPELRKEAISAGLQISDASLTAIAQKAYELGLTPTSPGTTELFRGIDSTGKPYVETIKGGIASTAKSNLAQANADYGTAYNQDWINQAAQSVALGTTTEQYWTDQVKSLAKSKYSAWGSQIDAGLTMKQIASPYIQAYSNILGVDPATITLDDKLLNQALQGNDPTKQAAMPLWDFEKAVRQDPRWATSKDAMDSLSNVGLTIAKQWGLMS
jgi:hypothetical protein